MKKRRKDDKESRLVKKERGEEWRRKGKEG